MPIDPCDEDAVFAEARELFQALAIFGDRAFEVAFADVAGACATETFERKDAVVAVVPHDTDRIAADFVEGFDDGSFRFREWHGLREV